MALDEERKRYHKDSIKLQRRIEAGRQPGTLNYIPLHHNKLNNVFNLTQAQFSLIGSTSGSGKTGYVDDMYLLGPWRSVVNIPNPSIDWNCMMFVMERSIQDRMLRWQSWFIYKDTGLLISPKAIMGRDGRGKLDRTIQYKVDSYRDEVSEIRSRMRMFDGRITPDLIKRQIALKGKQLGTLYRADGTGVLKDDGLVYIKKFDPKVTRDSQDGPEMYVELEHKGKKFTLAVDEHEYFPNKPNSYFYIIMDGLGLVDYKGYKNLKEAIDEVVATLQDARDVYGFSPVVVSQFNRGISNIERLKLHKSSMGPQESDFKDSGNGYHAADVVTALFDPYQMKAFDSKGLFAGYDLVSGMMAPTGYNRFRSVHVLKNTWGGAGTIVGMKFYGEVMHFKELPRWDSPEIQEVYSQTAMGL